MNLEWQYDEICECWGAPLPGTGRRAVISYWPESGYHAYISNGSCMGGFYSVEDSLEAAQEACQRFMDEHPDHLDRMKERAAKIAENRREGKIDWELVRPDG